MGQSALLKYSYLAFLSQPAQDRPIYRAIHRERPTRIVELGVGYAARAQRMIELASRCSPDEPIDYTGIDLFEARPSDRPGITLRLAYRLLRRLNAQVRLVPGDPYMVLAGMANRLAGTDLVVIGPDQDEESIRRAWSYLPRMLHADSLVFHARPEREGGPWRFVAVKREEVERLARASLRARAQAA